MVFGIRETLENVDSKFLIQETPDNILIRSPTNNRCFSAGLFMIRCCDSFPPLIFPIPSTFTIVDGPSFSNQSLDLSNFMVLQSLPEFNGATFQVLSTFNCLEFVGPDQTAEIGITTTIYDSTPGATASISACSSYLYRNYFILHDDETRGQIGREIELLAETPLEVIHGFPIIRDCDIAALKAIGFDWSDLRHYRVGSQRNCQISLTHWQNGFAVKLEPQFVNQVFTGTLCFSKLVVENAFTREIALRILIAGFRATILAACENGKLEPKAEGARKCVLTFAGNENGRNPIEIVCAALLACEELIATAGLEIYLVCREETAMVVSSLRRFVEMSGGKIIAGQMREG
jgi:hypothetical protein